MKTSTLRPELPVNKSDAVNKKESTMRINTLTPELLHKMNAY